jgi:hypothetical protein
MTERLLYWITAFGRFWYQFIVGDDWTMAAAVLLALVITAILDTARVPAWWLLPLVVVAMLGVSLRRASRG